MGSRWLNIETGRHNKVDRSGRIRPMCVGRIANPDVPADCFDSDEDAPDPIEDEHHAFFKCSACATTRQMLSDFFPSHVSTVSQFLNQPDCIDVLHATRYTLRSVKECSTQNPRLYAKTRSKLKLL